ncbi:MAG: site-2 protease family protein [Lachnospiraceae bacterium]|nr:site-2 protease family protein [Lachnospiraceae bacterium]
MGIVIAILALGFIIFIHEFGHFMMAKLFKVPVREFSIGMGPRVLTKIWNNTRYSLKAFPFGGSCAMIGEDSAGSGDFTEAEDVKIDENGLYDFDGVKYTKEEIDNNNFSVISPVKKFFICISGPAMNFLLAFVLAIFLVQLVGFDVPVINEVSVDSATMDATPIKLQSGDEIIELETPEDKEKVIAYRDIMIFMQLNNDDFKEKHYPLVITFNRDGQEYKTLVYPRYNEEEDRVLIGISFKNIVNRPTNIIETFKMAGKELYFYVKTTVMSLKLLIRGKLKTRDISGPVGTVAVMGDAISEASSNGVGSIFYTLATLIVLISSNLGVMNLLPIPALDGGRIVFAAIEMIIGRPIDKNIEGMANTVTMVLLLIFMVWIFGMDIYKLLSGTLY